MEPTNFAFNGAWVRLMNLFVNLFFFILNAVVGFFFLLIRILEKIDLYATYKTYVFMKQAVFGTDLLALILATLPTNHL